MLTLFAVGIRSEVGCASGLSFGSNAVGNIFVNSEGVVQVCIQDSGRIDSGEVQVLNELGVAQSKAEIKNGDACLNLTVREGFSRINARVRYRGGGGGFISTTAAVIQGQNELDRLQSPFGFFGVDASLPQAVMAGGRWNRTFFHIKGYVETQGGFVWKYPWTEDVLPADQTWIKQLTVIPAWLHGAEGEVTNADMYPPDDWGSFSALLKWAVAHDPAKARYIEVLNEPEWSWKSTDEELVRYFREAAKALHEADPGIKVLGPTLATVNMSKFKRLISLGVLDHLDAVSMHAYVSDGAPEGEFIGRVAELKAYLRSLGKGGLPIYLTEFGWTTEGGGWQTAVDELTQAQYISRSLILLRGLELDAIMPFCLKYKAKVLGDSGFSMLHEDGTPKPAYVAYANTVRWLSGVRGGGAHFQLSPSVDLVRFVDGEVFALWSRRGRVDVSIPCVSRRIEDMMGRPVLLVGGGADSCLVSVGGGPLFIEGKGLDVEQIVPINYH